MSSYKNSNTLNKVLDYGRKLHCDKEDYALAKREISEIRKELSDARLALSENFIYKCTECEGYYRSGRLCECGHDASA